MLTTQKKVKLLLMFLLLTLLLTAPAAQAKGNEYDAVCDHLKKNYQAKKVKIPFMWLARAAVGIVRPAGLKSFKVTVFKGLKFSRDTLDEEMQAVMKNSFSEDWSPILRVRSRDGEQVYMNMREINNNVKILLVSIEKDEATVIRARFNPDKLADFLDDPKIFGISLDDGDDRQTLPDETESEEPDEGN